MKKIILKEDKENVLDELKSSLFVSYMQTSGDAVKRGWKLIQSIGNFLCLTRVTQLTIVLYLKRKVNFKRFGSKLISIKSLLKKSSVKALQNFLWYCNSWNGGVWNNVLYFGPNCFGDSVTNNILLHSIIKTNQNKLKIKMYWSEG